MEALNLFGIIMAAVLGFAAGMMSIYIVQIYSDWTFELKAIDRYLEEKQETEDISEDEEEDYEEEDYE